MLNLFTLIAQNSQGIGSFKPVTDARQPTDLTGDPTTAEGVFGTLETYLSDIIGIITTLGALFFIVHSFIAAFNWITAAGDKGKIQKAQDRLIWSTLGLVLMIATYAIIGLIGTMIGLNLLEPGQMLNSVVPVIGN